MADIHRVSKVKKFVAKKVEFMEMQQKVIEDMKANGVTIEAINILEVSQTAVYNFTFDLCKEFGLEMPIVLGVK